EVDAGAFIHALRDVRRLLVVSDQHGATLVVDAVFGVVVADTLDGFARNLNIIHVRVRGDLAGEHHQTGVAQGFSGDAGFGILGQDGVQDGIGNLIGDLVRVAFGNGFRGKQVIVRRHRKLQLLV